MSDAQFAKEAAQGGLAEVRLGKLAQERGSNETVKSFGQRMIVEHEAAGDHLKNAAAKEQIALPNDLSARDQQVYDQLSKLNGSEFDRAYAKDMVEDHQKDLAAFQREADNGRNQNIKTFAAQTVPMIQEHLNQAREMIKTVSPATSRHGKSKKRVQSVAFTRSR